MIKGNTYMPLGRIRRAFPGLNEFQVMKVFLGNYHRNNCSGHRYNGFRKRNGSSDSQRRSGGGFKFRPEIPYLPAGNGEVVIEFGVDGFIEEEMFRRRYIEEYKSEQSMPKIDWVNCRRWKNKLKPTFNTRSESLGIRKQLENMKNVMPGQNPKKKGGY